MAYEYDKKTGLVTRKNSVNPELQNKRELKTLLEDKRNLLKELGRD